MDKSITVLRDSLKKLILQLKPHINPLSFLIITGKASQGKTALLQQGQLKHLSLEGNLNLDIYYNSHGIIVDLSESWINQSNSLLQDTLKQLNHCHRLITISGILFCIDVSQLLIMESTELAVYIKEQKQLLDKFTKNLNHRIKTTLILTKTDKIAGFTDFFQHEHELDLVKPLGFYFESAAKAEQLLATFDLKSHQLVEQLNQQVIKKIHPVRSSMKRILIREFPMQLTSLFTTLNGLIKEFSSTNCLLQAIYLTSAEQGGLSLDRLNKKIQQEYCLQVKDTFPQSVNFRTYFIQGALLDAQSLSKHPVTQLKSSHQRIMTACIGLSFISLFWIAYQYKQSTAYLNKIQRELISYSQLDTTSALYHLINANDTAEKLSTFNVSSKIISQLKGKLNKQTAQDVSLHLLPNLIDEIETTLSDNQLPPAERYHTLKIYLMFAKPEHLASSEILAWFKHHWTKQHPNQPITRNLALLKKILNEPLPAIKIKHQLVRDVRNFLNALPANYLYYALAKQHFPADANPVSFNGFTLSKDTLPQYLTKQGFKQIADNLPNITKQLQAENWILARQDLGDLAILLQQTYYHEYVTWWQQFTQHSIPLAINDMDTAIKLSHAINQQDSFSKLSQLIQQHTAPEPGNSTNSRLFNQEIARHFTEFNLISQSSIRDLSQTIIELEQWLTTFSVLHDQGKTAFTLTKARFLDKKIDNPLANLDGAVRRLPDPIASWTKKLTDDIWFLLMNDSRLYINQQWQQLVFQDYQNNIANRYPFDQTNPQEVSLTNFNHFFSKNGTLNQFKQEYISPFLDTSEPQWKLKESHQMVLPISQDLINQLIHANIISSMFFKHQSEASHIDFSLEKLSLDPIISKLSLSVGETTLSDNQDSNSLTHFDWPNANARLILKSIEGNQYELSELGPWAFFKLLQKVNVLEDTEDNHNLQILFEVNGNSGRYLLKTANQVNPFTPGILNGFSLKETVA